MKTKMMFLGVLLGIAISIVAVAYYLPGKMFIVEESKLNFNETVEAITKSAAENKWNIPQLYDLQATMSKNGYEVKPVKVFSLCKPDHAYQILGSTQERFVSALMPCRVSVYEKDGKTYISMLNAKLFSKFMGKNIGKVMSAASVENKQLFEHIIK
jgi:uncharacterized protein (DUF302 family)